MTITRQNSGKSFSKQNRFSKIVKGAIDAVFGKNSVKTAAPNMAARRLFAEPLEERALLSISPTYVDNLSDWTFMAGGDQGVIGTLDAGDMVVWQQGTTEEVSGLTWGTNAFDSIQTAINETDVNGTVNVAGGTYSEILNISKSLDLVGSSLDTPSLADAGFNTGITISGATTTVNLENLAIDNWFYGVMIQDADVSVTNTSITNSGYDGIVITTGGNVQVTDSLLTGNRVGIEVGLAGAGNLSVEGTVLSGNALRAIQVFTSSEAEIHNSDLSGYASGQALVNMNASAIVDASGNWWGTTDEAAVLAMTTGTADITPLLGTATDSNPGFGFDGDTANLHVTTLGAQTGTEGRIQEAVDAVDAGGTVSVFAGTYPESVNISRSLTLQGPNAGTSGSGTRAAEAIITGTGTEDNLVTINADDVTLDGMKVDGAASSAAYGILADGSYSNTTIENCVIQSVNGQFANGSGRNFGIRLRGDYSVSEGSVIANNLISNVYTVDGWSAGIGISGNYYTSILNNTIDNAKAGIAIDGFYAGAYTGATAVPVSNNEINAWETGIEYSNIRQNAIPFDVSSNDITGIAAPAGVTPDVWVGIIGTNINTGSSEVVEDNAIDGGNANASVMTVGYLGAANASTKYSNFTVSGGTVDNVDVGVGAVNYTPDDNPELEHDTGAVDITVDGVAINLNSSLVGAGQLGGLTVLSSPTGVAAFDLLELIERTTGTPMKTGATALGIDTSLGMTVTGGTTITGGEIGAMVDGADTSLAIDNTTFTSNTDILLSATSGVVSIGNNVSFNGNTFFIDNQSTQNIDLSGVSGLSFNAADNFRIEDKIYHAVDDASLGMVTWVANNLFVTDAGTDHSIQRAINLANAGDTINVEAGTYVENLNVNKGITLVSDGGRDATTIEGSQAGSVAAGGGNTGTICVSANGVHIGTASDGSDGFTILGYDVDTPGIEHAAVYYKPTADSDLSLIGNTIIANGEAAILGQYGNPETSLNISYNNIGGKTYTGNTVGGTSSVQYTVANVPRSLVYFGGSTSGIEFGNNTVTGSVGGLIEGTTDYYYNTGLTLDCSAATSTSEGAYIHDNTFAVASWATLRARGPYSTIENNSYDFSLVDSSDEKALGIFYANTDNDVVSGTRFLGDATNNNATGTTFDDDETFVLNCDSSEVTYYTDGTGVFIVGPEGTDYLIDLDWLEYTNETIPVPTFSSLPLLTDDIYVDDDWADGVDDPVIGQPVEVTFGGQTFYTIYGLNSFAAIQPAVDVAVAGDVVHVFAGTYTETISIDEAISLLGPNADYNPNTDAEPALAEQAVIMPDVDDAWGSILTASGSEITIRGLTFDGDNPALTSADGDTRNGVDINSGEAIWIDGSQATISNNIVRNFTYAGIDTYGGSSAVNGNLISENLIQNIGCGIVYEPWGPTEYFWGMGVLLDANYYADVTDNVIEDVIMGLQTHNFYKTTGITDDTLTASITGNTISATKLGIFNNLMYSGADAFEISDNELTAADPSNTERPNQTEWAGILFASLSNLTGEVTFSGNTITGPAAGDARTTSGIEVWNCADTANITIDSTNTISSVNYGVFANNYEGYNSNGGNGAHITIDGTSITASDIGVYVLDSPNNTADPSAPVVVTITGGTTITGAEIGVKVEGENTSLAIDNVTFSGADTDIALGETIGPITIGGNITFTGDNFYIDNRSALDFDLTTTSGTTFDETDNFRIEDKMYHALDDSASGLITWVAGNLYVTQDSGSIQRAIDAASSGDTINVEAGTYVETLTIDKSLDLLGPNADFNPNTDAEPAVLDQAVIMPDVDDQWGSLLSVTGGDVTIRGLTFDGDNPALTSAEGNTRNGVDINSGEAIYAEANSVAISNNIIKNFSYAGIDADGGNGAVNGNTISENLIQNIGCGLVYEPWGPTTYYWGMGICVANGLYADITDNVITDSIKGIQTNNYHSSTGITDNTLTASITGNTINVTNIGIFYNLMNSGTDAFEISGNTITAADPSNTERPDVAEWAGILFASLKDLTGEQTFSNNTITGPAVGDARVASGVEVWNCADTANITIDSTNTISSVNYGVFANNYEGYNSNAGSGANVTIDGANITASDIGVYVLDSPNNTADPSASVVVTITGGTTITGAEIGVKVEGENTSLVIDNVTFSGADTDIALGETIGPVTIGDNITFTGDNFYIDNRSALDFDLTTTSGTTFDETDNFRIEDKMYHALDDSASGLITWVAGNLYVTQDSGSIQRAIDAASSGDTINVEAGMYLETIDIDKSLSIIGPKSGASRNDGTEWNSETTESWGSAEAIAAGEAVLRADAIDHVVDIADGIDVTLSGMVIEARNRTDSTNAHLIYVAAKDLQVDTVHLDNNVIGPITGVGQDGTMGRFGIDLDSQGASNNGVAGTVSGNKIFGAEGNGAGLFIIGTHYSSENLSDYSGMTISDNDIYGSNRSGVELAGGITGLTITGNSIHDNGFIWDAANDQYTVSAAAQAAIAADADQLKYGNGINVMRTGTIINLGSPIYNTSLTISGNSITDNAKHGLYMGPMVDDVAISGNTISDNGDSGIVLDESAYYYATKPTAPAYGASGTIAISNNTIADNAQSGIELLGQPTGVTISGTAISGSSVGLHMADLNATAMANVTVTAGTTITGTGTGILLEGEYASLTADGLTLDGFQRAVYVLEGSLSLSDSTISNSGYNGLYVETDAATSQEISLTNVDFINNNTNGATNVDDVAFFLFNGSVTMDGVDITSSNSAGHAIQFRGAGNPSDSLTWGGVDATLSNVTVDGTVAKNALLFQCYSDVSGVSLANVDLTAATTGWSDVALDALNTLNLGSTKLKTLDIWGVGGVDATGAEFYDLADGTTLLTSGFDIEDQVLHAIDATGLGAVVWDAGNWYLTPASFIAGASAVDPTYIEAAQLQRAVAAAAAGDTVYIKEGTYSEGAQVVFDKNLTVIGEGMSGANATIMTPGFDTGNSGDTRGWWLVNPGVDISFSNLAMDGTGSNVYQGIRSYGTTAVDQVAFSNIQYPGYNGVAYVTMGTGLNSVTNSTFENIGRIGVFFYGAGTEGVFSGNTYTGKGSVDALDYALEVGGGATATAADNTVTGNTGIASSDNSHSAAFMVTTFYGAGSALTLTGGNSLTGNYSAIFVGYDETDESLLTISGADNDLSGNEVGIDIVGGTANISDADLSGNGVGIEVSGGATVSITGSNLTGYTGIGGNYAIENLNEVAAGDPNVTATGNDFGSYVDPTMIENVIFDDTDDAAFTQVIYTNAINQQTAPAVVWVDDDWAGTALGTNMGDLDGDSTDEIYGVDAFAVIQDAVNAVEISGDVNIFDGNYDGEILITKDGITLAGETEAGVQILPTRGFADDNYGIIVDGANGVSIDNLTIDGDPTDTGIASFKDAIHWTDNGGDNASITNVTIDSFDRRGISVWPENVIGTSIIDCTISNGTADNYGYAHAIKINGTGEVISCTITNVTAGILSTCDVNGGELVITDNVITDLTGETATPFDIGINIWCKASGESPVVTIQRNTIIASVADNTGMYVVRPGDGSVISDNTITLSGEGGIGIETGWSYDWGVAIENNNITMGRGGTGIVVTGSGDAADPMIISGNTITNTGADDAFTNDYYGYSEREVGILLSGDAYTSRTGDAHYDLVAEVSNNVVNGFKEGIAVIDLADGNTLGGPADVTIFNNDLSGNGLALVNATVNGNIIDASGNWWGTTDAAAVAALISGSNVDYSPWLGTGTDTDTTATGFQGDFSTLYVDDDSAKSDAGLGFIDEAIGLVTNSTIYVNPGVYAETVTIDKPVTLEGIADSVTGDLPVLDASGEAVAMTIISGDVSVSNLDISGDASTEMGINVNGPAAGIANVSITNSKIHDIGAFGTLSGIGINLVDVDNVTISGITVGDIQPSAVQPGIFTVADSTSSNVTISANTYDSAITGINVVTLSPSVTVDESASIFNEQPSLGYIVDFTNVGEANFTLPQHAKVRGLVGWGDATAYTPSIQTAVDYALDNGTINLTAGTFTEQVVIDDKNLSIVGSGTGVSTIASPAGMTESVEIPGKGDQYAVILAKGTDTVNLSDLTLDGANQGDTNYKFEGILYFDAGGTISNIEVTNVMNSTFSGVQHGVGIYAYANEGTARTITLENSNIHDFQKNATAFVGADLTANVIGNTIVGAGVTNVTAQNGIQISGGASGLVQGNTISNISYDGNWSASGILVMTDGAVTVENNTLTNVMTNILLDGIDEVLVQNNDISDGKYGVLYYSRGTGDNAKILNNTFTDMTYGVRSASSGTGTGLLEVEGNTFDSIDYGIVNFGDSFKVVDNDFIDNGMGLYLYAYCGNAATMVQDNTFSFVETNAADSVGVYVTNGAIVDAGQLAGSTNDFTGLGVSTGGNDFSAFTSADTEGNGAAIYNGNADEVAGPQGTPLDMTAFGNTFSVLPEDVIYHDADDNALGFVDHDNLGGLTWSLSASDIVENDTVTFSGSFTNDSQAHVLEITWGDGTTATVNIPQGTFTFSVDHTYLDDTGNEPSTTVTYPFSFTLLDSSSASLVGSSDVDVANVAPVINSLTVDNIDENGTVTLSGTYSDVGTLDTHTLTIDWADGDSETITVTGGVFSVTHQYLDDGISGTASDDYTISVTLTDDDTATDTATATTTVTNVAPTIDSISASLADENGIVTLTGTFSDTGTLDIHELTINWADGSPSETVTVTGGSFSIDHQYLDDGISGTVSDDYTIDVTLTDDDGGLATDSATTTISNVAPVIETLDVTPSVEENGVVTLTGTYSDVGTLDTHTLTINWGDGSAATTVDVTNGEFSFTHQYLDDDPTGTAADNYTITVTLTDDDTSMVTADVATTVTNVAPVVAITGAPVTSMEGTSITLVADVTDPGTLDTFDYTWVVTKGGSPYLTDTTSGATFTFTPNDNAEYIVELTVNDDDLGIGTDSVTITVSDVAPTLTLTGDATTNEGQVYTLTLSDLVDPGNDTIMSYSINWGDGTVELYNDVVNNPPLGTYTHLYDDNAAVTGPITVTLVNEDGVFSNAATFDLTVNNVAPTGTPWNTSMDSGPINEGSSAIVMVYAPSDPSSADMTAGFSYAYDFDNDGTLDTLYTPGASTATVPGSYLADNPEQIVGISIRDKDGGTTLLTTTVTINNVTPTIDAGLDAEAFVDQSFTRTLTFTDPGNDALWTITADYGDGSPVETFTVSNRVFTLDHTYTTTGSYTVSVTVMDKDNASVSDSFNVDVFNDTFRVINFTPTVSGFEATFNRAPNLCVLNLYDGEDAAIELPDLVMVGSTTGEVQGSMTWDASTNTLSFVKTGSILATDSYTVTLRSNADAFVDGVSGALLDGDYSYSEGGNFVATFDVTAADRVLSLPDLARGAGQDVNVPATNGGLPVTLSDANGVTSIDFHVEYDPTILDINGIVLSSLPSGWSFTVNSQAEGVFKVSLYSTSLTPLVGLDQVVAELDAVVPDDAPYATSQVIKLTHVRVNEDQLNATGDYAIHKATYLGDTDGDGMYVAYDASLISRVVVGIDSGFDAHDWTDPSIIGDTTGNGDLSGLDASYVLEKSVGLLRPEIPDVPAGVTISIDPGAIDPQLGIGTVEAHSSTNINVPVTIDIEDGAENVHAATFTVTYDPTKLSLDTAQVESTGLCDGWTILANETTPGVVTISMYANNGPSGPVSGEIASLPFTIIAPAATGEYVLDIEKVNESEGGFTWTDSVDGAILPRFTPGDANCDGKVDGSDVTIVAVNWQAGVNDGQTATWSMGDFNHDGKVDGSDVTILAVNWQSGVNSTVVATSDPEPESEAEQTEFTPPTNASFGVATVPQRSEVTSRGFTMADAADAALTDATWDEVDMTAIAKEITPASAKKLTTANDEVFALGFDPYSDPE